MERPLRKMSVALRHSLTKPPPLSFISSLLRYHTSHFSSLLTFFLCQTPYISIFSFRFFVHLLLIFSLSLYLFKKIFSLLSFLLSLIDGPQSLPFYLLPAPFYAVSPQELSFISKVSNAIYTLTASNHPSLFLKFCSMLQIHTMLSIIC